TIEIMHLACSHLRRSDRQSRLVAPDQSEVDEFVERRFKFRCRVIASIFCSEPHVWTEVGRGIGFIESGYTACQRLPIGEASRELRPQHQRIPRSLCHAPPELLKCGKTIVRLVTNDERRVDSANRRADHPIRLDPRLMERVIDARLICAERAASL